MPTFPTYRGELPKCLNPLNVRHYFLLAYWVYFRPTALKCYLHQANPSLYRSGLSILQTISIPAYRNLYLMAPVTAAVFSVTLGLPILLVVAWSHAAAVHWLRWSLGLASGVTFGLIIGIAASQSFGLPVGLAGTVAIGIASSLSFSTTISLTGSSMYNTLPFALLSFAAFGIVWGLTFNVTFGSRFAAGGTALGIAVGMAGGAALGWEGFKTGNVTAGLIIGLAGSILSAGIFSLGASRLPFFLIQMGLLLRNAAIARQHPLEWDELAVLPLPGVRQALLQRLRQDEPKGLQFIAQVTSNPFQRWTAQAALQSYLHTCPSPLNSIYSFLANPDLDAYILTPVSEGDWGIFLTLKRSLLGELDRRKVEYARRDWAVWWGDRLVRDATWLLCDRRKTPLTRFAGMLYELLDEERNERNQVSATARNLVSYAPIYTGLSAYSGGEEIARTFETMAVFLSYDNVLDLPAAASPLSLKETGGTEGGCIRPAVLTALARLGQVGAEVAAYRDSTSRANKLAALARAADALKDLHVFIASEVVPPEQYILHRITYQWEDLIIQAGGEVGRAEIAGPVANPYVAGNPVTGSLFVGREDILRRLEELWCSSGGLPMPSPSVVIYGHRRMGKSSILHNLGARFGANTVVVDFNMQRVGLVASTGELLYNLALALYDALPPAARGGLEGGLPSEEHFTAHNPYTAFDQFLKQLDRVRGETRFIITVDEFELIEQLIAEGKLEARLLDFWRGLIQTYAWFVMAFAGLHTLQEMTRDYWHPLYGSVMAIPVSFLSHDAAWQLITNPSPDFPLDYDADAVERIIALTHGQPYLAQLVGHGLVTRFNRQSFEEGVERARRFALADVEAVITTPEFYRDGDAYFTGVWRQAETTQPGGQTAVLRVLATGGERQTMSAEEAAHQADLSVEEAKGALGMLAQHDVIVQENGEWKFTVELMRRWVAQKEE